MILVRDIFQLKFGRAKEAIELLKQNMGNIQNQKGRGPDRLLTDLTGQFYTLVMETTFDDMADYEQSLHKVFESSDWQKGYKKFAELIESGRREIFTIVPVEQPGMMQQRAEATAKVGSAR
jgi:hypothetical protein